MDGGEFIYGVCGTVSWLNHSRETIVAARLECRIEFRENRRRVNRLFSEL